MIGEDFAKLAVKHWSALLSINFSCQLKNSCPWFVRSNVRIYFIRMTGRLSRNWHAALIIWNHLLSDSQNSLGDQGIIGLLGGRRVEIGHFWEKLGRSFGWDLHYVVTPRFKILVQISRDNFCGKPWLVSWGRDQQYVVTLPAPSPSKTWKYLASKGLF